MKKAGFVVLIVGCIVASVVLVIVTREVWGALLGIFGAVAGGKALGSARRVKKAKAALDARIERRKAEAIKASSPDAHDPGPAGKDTKAEVDAWDRDLLG